MNQEMNEKLELVKKTCKRADQYRHAGALIMFDLETLCPREGKGEQGELLALLETEEFKIKQDKAFTEAVELLYQHLEELLPLDQVLISALMREVKHTRQITTEMANAFSMVYNRAYIDWERAKQESDFSIFKDTLQQVLDVSRKKVELWEALPGEPTDSYDRMLDDYERGMTAAQLKESFDVCKARLLPFLKELMQSPKKIRTDFMHRPVSDEQQRKLAEALLKTLGFDLTRGAYALTEHPFTETITRNDVRLTTHFHEDNFISSLYSVMHECGHALFAQLDAEEHYDHFITGERTCGMDESVSRFYENRIGRSREFIHLIYPTVCEIFPEVMEDVSENELYEAVNYCTPSLIRTEADELTYTFHIIIRFEIEMALVAGEISVSDIPAIWNQKYQEYLGITPQNDREGCLQDVHWSSGFGYFPSYLLGNMFNSMYAVKMNEEINVGKCIESGDFTTINRWMQEHVFRKADILSPLEWIRDITGREFSPEDFLNYLEEKYSKIYDLKR